MKLLLRRLSYLLYRRRHEAELREEIETHRTLRQQHLEDRGLSPADAARTSRRALGNTTLGREDARAAWLAPWLESVVQDLRYGVRTLARHPSFTLTSIATMVIGVGLCSLLFSAYNTLLLRAWPVEYANDLVLLFHRGGRVGQNGFSLDEARDFTRSQSLAAVGAFRAGVSRMSADAEARGAIVYYQYVSSGYFDATGVRMHLGRSFRPEETAEGVEGSVAIISYRFWQREFAGAPDVVGRPIYQVVNGQVNRRRVTVIGVARDGWNGELPSRDDVWLPLSALRQNSPKDPPFAEAGGRCCVRLIGRLKPGVTKSRASAELTGLLQHQVPSGADAPSRVDVTGSAPISRSWRDGLIASTLLLVSTLAVMLLTGANIAHLQLARAMSRQREILTRMALGAGRARVIRQLITESLLISIAAGALCVPLLYAAAPTLERFSELPEQVLAPDTRVLLYCFAAAATMSLVFGLSPALHSTRLSLAHTAGRAAVPLGRLRFNSVLLSLQIALTVSILTGASLMVRAAANATTAEHVGFQAEGISVITIVPDGLREQATANAAAFMRAVETRLSMSSTPTTGLVDTPPFYGDRPVTVRRPSDRPAAGRQANIAPMSAEAFGVLGIPFVEGRPARNDADVAEAVVSRRLAEAMWPGESVIGQRITVTGQNLPDDRNPFIVVGVTRDVLYGSLETNLPTLYVAAGTITRYPSIIVRGTEPAATDPIKAMVAGIDPRASVIVRALAQQMDSHLNDFRDGTRIAWGCGLLSLVLAAFGVFGVFAHLVETRRREIGIRLALGAERRQILGLLLRATRRATLGGLAGGLVVSLSIGPVMGAYLYGLGPFDPMAFGIVAVILMLTGLAATLIPARRALNVDPAVTLGHDT